jgi:hypothetical protein
MEGDIAARLEKVGQVGKPLLLVQYAHEGRVIGEVEEAIDHPPHQSMRPCGAADQDLDDL